jgi:paraquat-inducible protein B
MYFDDSVKGLNIGAPVSLRGVQVGTVHDISIIHDSATGKIKIPVIAEFHPEAVINLHRQGETIAQNIKHLVETFGLRAQLRSLSLVTGQLFVQVDYHPETEYTYKGDGKMIEIPTIPSTLEQLGKKLEEFNISMVVEDVSTAAASIAQLASTPELKEAINNLNEVLKSTNDLVITLNTQINPLISSTRETLANIDKTMDASTSLVENVDNKLEPLDQNLQNTITQLQNTLSVIDQAAVNIKSFSNERSPTIYKLNTALDELANAARSVRALADTLERHPEAIIQGKKSGR